MQLSSRRVMSMGRAHEARLVPAAEQRQPPEFAREATAKRVGIYSSAARKVGEGRGRLVSLHQTDDVEKRSRQQAAAAAHKYVSLVSRASSLGTRPFKPFVPRLLKHAEMSSARMGGGSEQLRNAGQRHTAERRAQVRERAQVGGDRGRNGPSER